MLPSAPLYLFFAFFLSFTPSSSALPVTKERHVRVQAWLLCNGKNYPNAKLMLGEIKGDEGRGVPTLLEHSISAISDENGWVKLTLTTKRSNAARAKFGFIVRHNCGSKPAGGMIPERLSEAFFYHVDLKDASKKLPDPCLSGFGGLCKDIDEGHGGIKALEEQKIGGHKSKSTSS